MASRDKTRVCNCQAWQDRRLHIPINRSTIKDSIDIFLVGRFFIVSKKGSNSRAFVDRVLVRTFCRLVRGIIDEVDFGVVSPNL
ncbi:hypothetical protein E4U25_001815 [Claviceps purpurea]|nr:hypothetical protein E4U25_001815 [Claviceps purpurea]